MKKIANRMAVTVEELDQIRRRTLNNALKAISSRHPTKEKGSITRAADIALVSKNNPTSKVQ